MTTDELSLEEKTMSYWKVSQAFQQRPEAANIGVGDAIHHLTDICEKINPVRPLFDLVAILQDQLINGVSSVEAEQQRVKELGEK